MKIKWMVPFILALAMGVGAHQGFVKLGLDHAKFARVYVVFATLLILIIMLIIVKPWKRDGKT